MKSLKDHPSVQSNYYYYLLKYNQIDIPENIDNRDFSNVSIDFSKIRLLKYPLAIKIARLQLSVSNLKIDGDDLVLKYKKKESDLKKNKLKNFCDTFNSLLDSYTFVKSPLFFKLSSLQKIVPVNILRNFENLMWYAFSIPHRIEFDVIALMCMIETCPNITDWINKKSDANLIDIYSNKYGDIYFSYELWKNISDFLTSNDILKYCNIDTYSFLNFKYLKNKYNNMKNWNMMILSYSITCTNRVNSILKMIFLTTCLVNLIILKEYFQMKI